MCRRWWTSIMQMTMSLSFVWVLSLAHGPVLSPQPRRTLPSAAFQSFFQAIPSTRPNRNYYSSIIPPASSQRTSSSLMMTTTIASTQNTSLLEEMDDDFSTLPTGMPEGFVVVHQYETPATGFELPSSSFHEDTSTKSTTTTTSTTTTSSGVTTTTTMDSITSDIERRLGLSKHNVTLPVALMLLDPKQYPTFSRARKACRKGVVLVHRGPSILKHERDDGATSGGFSDVTHCIRGRVGDRVYPGDVIGIQTRLGDGNEKYGALGHHREPPPFDLPVVYEDDHFAIVNKPAGVVVYAHRGAGHGRMTVRSALPYALTPPRAGTLSIIRRPMAVHRLDRPTSGLLLIAKTKPAMVDLGRQFVERKVKKTYVAIVNGVPDEPVEISITAEEAHQMGLDVDPGNSSVSNRWQLIDCALDDKHAITAWRALRYTNSLKATDGLLTLVELKPKTGRYHQLRRHMAWVCERPLVGDKAYDGGGGDAMALRGRGLFLCSNRVCCKHPYFNTDKGRIEWDSLSEAERLASGFLYESKEGAVMVAAEIDLPEKFDNFLANEGDRYLKLSEKIENK